MEKRIALSLCFPKPVRELYQRRFVSDMVFDIHVY